MERDYLPSDELMILEFSNQSVEKRHQHENFELLYVLEGSITLNLEQETYRLRSEDMIIVNYNRQHSYSVDDNTLVARFLISYSKMKEFLESETLFFWCNSVVEQSGLYDETRQLISKLLNLYVVEGERKSLSKTSLHYQLMHLLAKNFLLTSDDIRYRRSDKDVLDRMEEIFQFIRSNYRNPITLQDLSDHFFLSTTYLSKYIKQRCEVGFIDILNNVRLSHAMVDLLQSDQSVMKVAMSNGFASVAAFNKVFKEAYNTTPSKFRRKKKQQNSTQELNTENQKILQQIENYLSGTEQENVPVSSDSVNILINNQASPHAVWKDKFSKLINVGSAFDLTKADFQEQILLMKRELGITYVRFWDIYATRLHLDIHATKDNLNFNRLDKVLDFLVNNDLIPYIELGFKPLRLMKSAKNSLLEVQPDLQFTTDKEMYDFFTNFLKHCCNRYGVENVEKWYFEYWKDVNVSVKNQKYILNLHSLGHQDSYLNHFSIIASAFRKVLPTVNIGGGGFPIHHYDKEELKTLLSSWRKQERPNFLTFTAYPYRLESDNSSYYEHRISDMQYLENKLLSIREVAKETGFSHLPLHISEFGLTLSNRNLINDHVAKGAFLLQTAFTTHTYADLFGYYVVSDLYNEYFDSQHLLFGGSGLISKVGIPKPAFFALDFLHDLATDIYYSSSNCLVTKNKARHYRIVCHNFKQMSASYYLMDEENINLNNLSHLFEDKDSKDFHFTLTNMPNGIYVIKSRLVNEEYGSVQNAWKNYYQDNDLSIDELKYFKCISMPKFVQSQVTVEDHNLDFNINLKANEIRYLEIKLLQ